MTVVIVAIETMIQAKQKRNDNFSRGGWRMSVVKQGCQHFQGECFDCPFKECIEHISVNNFKAIEKARLVKCNA